VFLRLRPCRLTAEEKYALCRSIGEECIQEAELRALLAKKPNPVAYDGFEPSGRMHIAQGVLKALNVNKLTKSGVTFRFWCARVPPCIELPAARVAASAHARPPARPPPCSLHRSIAAHSAGWPTGLRS
jgi:hypothetical protein